MKINTIAEIVLKYKEKEYKFNFDFGSYIPSENAEYLFEDGNYACDCNRSMFIKKYCNKDFLELQCGGDEIDLISFTIIQEGQKE
jgi:hypothetical protein